jgi:CBS domain-containing protein
MKVESILAAKGESVETIRPDREIALAAVKLRDARIGALVVSTDGKEVKGIISERDIVRGLAERGANVLDLTVRNLMTPKVITCTPEDSVTHLMKLMTSKRIRHLPVISADGELCGIVSIGDVVKNRLEELELEATVLRDAYISRG